MFQFYYTLKVFIDKFGKIKSQRINYIHRQLAIEAQRFMN